MVEAVALEIGKWKGSNQVIFICGSEVPSCPRGKSEAPWEGKYLQSGHGHMAWQLPARW